jgi:hypothetical protein
MNTTTYSPLKIVYGFNPLTPLDLMHLPIDEMSSLDGRRKTELLKSIHERVQLQFAQKNEKFASQANKGRRRVIFEPEDWVWVHMRKKRFISHRRTKLHSQGNGPFQILEKLMIMLIKWIFQVNVMSLLLSMLLKASRSDSSWVGRGRSLS